MQAERGEAAEVSTSCPLESPLSGRLPGLLALAAIPAAILVKPLFFILVGSLLATLSLLLAPAGHRRLGLAGLAGALAAAGYHLFIAL